MYLELIFMFHLYLQ